MSLALSLLIKPRRSVWSLGSEFIEVSYPFLPIPQLNRHGQFCHLVILDPSITSFRSHTASFVSASYLPSQRPLPSLKTFINEKSGQVTPLLSHCP